VDYNVTILNESLDFIREVAYTKETYFELQVFNQNLTLGTYFIRVDANSTLGTSFDIENFNLTRNSELNVSARYALTNASLTEFNITLVDAETAEVYFNETVDGVSLLPVKRHHNYTVTFDAINYSTNSSSVTLNDTAFQNLRFDVLRYNSLTIFFYDETRGELLNETTVFLDIISDDFSNNYSTTNASLVADLLYPTSYQARYYAAGYVERFYYFTVTADTAQVLNLYLNNDTDQILIEVRDIAINPVEGAVVMAQRKDPVTNTYVTVEIGTTDFEGEVVMSLTKNDEWYRFIVTLDDVVRLTTEDAYITADTVTLTLPGTGSTGEEIFNYLDIVGDVSYSTVTTDFTFDFVDPNNVQRQYCLRVYTGEGLLGEDCTTNNAGTLTVSITPENGTSYRGDGSVLIGDWLVIDSDTYTAPTDSTPLGNLGLLGQFLISLALIIVVYKFPEWMPFMLGISLLLGRSMNLTTLEWPVLTGVAFVMTLISVWLGKLRNN
jgi:hypothetical protein